MKIRSLRSKIISLFILLMVADAGFVTLILYHSLKNELISKDNDILINRADQLAKLIVSGIDIKSLPVYFRRMMDMRQDVIKITDADNHVIVDTNPETALNTRDKLNYPDNQETFLISYQNTEDDMPVSVVNFTIQTPEGKLYVTLAKRSVDRSSVLGGYLQKSLIVSVIAILLMAVFSVWLIRRGLKDITHLSRITAKTDLHSLGQEVDISRLPDELKSLGDSLNIMRSRLKNDFVRLTQLADDLAHELRTPINAMKIQNEITLQRIRTADEYETIIASNTEELDKLARIIQNILFIARAKNKNITLKRETIVVSELVEDVYELLIFYADEKDIRFINRISGITMTADKVLLMQIMVNIISNAVKYSYKNTDVIASAESNHGNTIISVMNKGDAIENSEQVFTRFWRGDNARTSEGSGLGLSIVQAITELHSGEVRFERTGSYNTVTLIFPDVQSFS